MIFVCWDKAVFDLNQYGRKTQVVSTGKIDVLGGGGAVVAEQINSQSL